jgi:hypothetical protein
MKFQEEGEHIFIPLNIDLFSNSCLLGGSGILNLRQKSLNFLSICPEMVYKNLNNTAKCTVTYVFAAGFSKLLESSRK